MSKVKCSGGTIEAYGGKCNCHIVKGEKSDCFRCEITGGPSGTKVCLRCRNGAYLNAKTATCVGPTQCEAGTVPTGLGSYGRECLAPFVCNKGRHPVTGRVCKCPASCMR